MRYQIKRVSWSSLPPLDVEIRDDVPEGERLRVAVVAAVQSRADLRGAYLSGADLRGADLSRANLRGAYLSGADLSRADLRGADLRGAYLSGTDLSRADLSRADLSGADLSRADLRGADLRGAYLSRADLSGTDLRGAYLSRADLRGAYLSGADLSGADLSRADLPSPTMLLLASWSTVSDALCADLMLFDAACHPDPEAFDRWASGGSCPYSGVKVERAANFVERRDLWGKGEMCRPYNLAMRLIAEKCPEWSGEERVAFEAKFNGGGK